MTADARLEDDIAGIAALHAPIRGELYRYVVSRTTPVSRDEAAMSLCITRSLAVFHLDKLVTEGLLEVEFRRLTGRSGPGAGRPSKLYRQGPRQLDVSLPPRRYELAARLFAAALDKGGPVEKVARAFGEELGRKARQDATGSPRDDLHAAAERILRGYGFEPFRVPDGEIHLNNCPFHALVKDHREMVCGMNLALLKGLLAGLNVQEKEAVRAHRSGRCCVALRPTTP